jgi:hypothetical protein
MRAFALLAVLLTAVSSARVSAQQPVVRPDEYQVKAAYLAGFARFIERADGVPVVLCSASEIRMLEALLHVSAAKAPAIDVRSISKPDAVVGCTVLFIGPSRLKLLRELVGTPHESGVLIVGEGPGFIDSGGALEFVWTDDRIQFNASIVAMQRSGVRVSSRLLTLARNLRGSAQ